ncbi:MAG: cofactor-independent phosphoglycerate mutase [Chitinivibrionales bacterium]|nr:cofactor-independent phosphoglycerate mutase [Chitinivibrionales bacterium]MBD3395909.1 cofactor-independent phosphoglycerate mutase [Chitinivibrionales bacterium]
MKYAILVGDGMADAPIDAIGGLTPLEHASTPHMDSIAARGRVGLVKTVPDGMAPGSDVANMSLLGYNPAQYYSGRAPIEAASMGIRLAETDTAFRCNLVHIEAGRMVDYSAGHIETKDAHRLIKDLQQLNTDARRFYPGVSYRHLLVLRDFPQGGLALSPPHDISGKPVAGYVPTGPGDTILADLSAEAHEILAGAGTNRARAAAGKTTATDIWLWGHGKAVSLPTLGERFGLRGSVISAVDLVRGLGKLAGLTVRIVEGATGYLGTNYAGKVAAARAALDAEDFVYLHVEAPDETSHEGSLEKKLQAIEEFDRHVVGEMLKLQDTHNDMRVLVLPDHGTWLSLKTHHRAPVPFAVAGAGIRPDGGRVYCERAAADKPLYEGVSLFETFVNGTFS